MTATKSRADATNDWELSKKTLDEIFHNMVREDTTHFVAVGTPKVTMKFPDGTYRKKPIDPGQELQFAESYVGAKGQPIWCFKPFDAQTYDQIELSTKDIENVLPAFSGAACKANEVKNDVSLDVLFRLIMKRLKNEQLAAESAAAEQALTSAQSTYKNHPLFGRF